MRWFNKNNHDKEELTISERIIQKTMAKQKIRLDIRAKSFVRLEKLKENLEQVIQEFELKYVITVTISNNEELNVINTSTSPPKKMLSISSTSNGYFRFSDSTFSYSDKFLNAVISRFSDEILPLIEEAQKDKLLSDVIQQLDQE
jgi:metal-dependent amidase/aminoacylase/carboxypeptidase family protein